jgi:MscS family membrane protein
MWQQVVEYYEKLQLIQAEAGWLAQLLVVVILTLLASLILSFTLRHLEAKLKKTRTPWDDALIEAINAPLQAAIWVMGFIFAAETLEGVVEWSALSHLPLLREVIFVAITGWALIRFVDRGSITFVKMRRSEGKFVDLTAVNAMTNISKLVLGIATLLMLMQTMGYSISALLTFGGIGGIAVGFAAKDLLANFFGAIMIYFDKPFKIGDWVRSPDRDIEGTVEKIGWRMTTIRTFDKRPLYVPNAVFTQIAVQNPSRMSHRRIYETIGIRYDDLGKMQAITDEVREMLLAHEEIDDSQTMIVQFNAFNASSCDFFVYTFTHTTEWVKFHEIKHEILLKIAEIIEEHGAEIAFPTRTLHLQGDTALPAASE